MFTFFFLVFFLFFVCVFAQFTKSLKWEKTASKKNRESFIYCTQSFLTKASHNNKVKRIIKQHYGFNKNSSLQKNCWCYWQAEQLSLVQNYLSKLSNPFYGGTRLAKDSSLKWSGNHCGSPVNKVQKWVSKKKKTRKIKAEGRHSHP